MTPHAWPFSDLPEITQIGLVVEDLERTMAAYYATLGWGPWLVYEHKPPVLHDLRLRDEPVEFSMLAAETQVGPIGFELLQPLEGRSVYREWLAAKGEGLHHLACTLRSGDGAASLIARCGELGIKTLTSGRLGASGQFYYFDTEPLLKMIIETGSSDPHDTIEPIRVYPA
jgi:methylmalonyl-CoA/ethylmalonyl-CoA epimerase